MSSMGSAAEARAILYPYQRRWIDDQSRFKIGMFSRQTGKTYTSTLEIAEDMVKAEVEKRRVRWVILSRGERQAREAMEEGLKVHLRAYGAAFESLESDFHLADATSCKSLEVVMAHGSRVTALPANPDTARGFSANVFLDEFAFHADSRKIWAALFPVVSRNGLKLRVVSTPNGKGNKFYDLMTSAETAGWSKHVVDIYQAVADGLPRDVEALRAALNDPDAWAQEYELQWLDEASAWLSYDLINAVEHPAELCGRPLLCGGGHRPPARPFCHLGAGGSGRRLMDAGTGDATRSQLCRAGWPAGRCVPALPGAALLHGPDRHGRKARGRRPPPSRQRPRGRGSVHIVQQAGPGHGGQAGL